MLVSFLDVDLKRKEEGLHTSVHIKSTNSGDCINFSSICPDRYKTGVIKSFLHRAFHISCDWNTFHEEVERIRQMLVNNNFPVNIVDKTISIFLKKINQTNNNNDTTNKDIKIFYRSQMSSNYQQEETKLSNIIQKNIKSVDEEKQLKIIIYYKTKKFKNLVIKNNTTKPTDFSLQHHVVYQYTCNKNGCHSIENKYIGFTTTTLKERMVQHSSIKKHHSSIHKKKIGYKEILENTKVLVRNNFKQDLLIAEALLIKYEKPQLNNKEEGSTGILHVF